METTVKKNRTGYGYKYTDIAQIHNYLEENNMRYYQEIQTLDGTDYIMTYRYIDGKWEDKAIRGCRVVDATLQGVKNPAQEQGSALTYARRYSLLMAFGLATEDDDAQSLSRKKEIKQEPKLVEKITPNQITRIKELFTEEEQKKALEMVKLDKLEDLTTVMASQLIAKKEGK